MNEAVKDGELTAGVVPEEKKDEKRGARNLVILGVLAAGLALVGTGLSLWLYQASGDVYLDRSRPGYISEEEPEDEAGESYEFAADGVVNERVLEEYLRELNRVMGEVEEGAGAFGAGALSDENLGI